MTLSRMAKKLCLNCSEPIPPKRKALYCSPSCSTKMGNKAKWNEKNRVSSCCSAKMDVFPDQNGVLQYMCLECNKRTRRAKLYKNPVDPEQTNLLEVDDEFLYEDETLPVIEYSE